MQLPGPFLSPSSKKKKIVTSLINNSGLIILCVKTMNVFTCGEEISKLAV